MLVAHLVSKTQRQAKRKPKRMTLALAYTTVNSHNLRYTSKHLNCMPFVTVLAARIGSVCDCKKSSLPKD